MTKTTKGAARRQTIGQAADAGQDACTKLAPATPNPDHDRQAAGLAASPLAETVSSALRLLRFALDDLQSGKRRARRRTIGTLGFVISRLESGLKTRAEMATEDLGVNLLRALPPDVTVAEIEGARAILTLTLAALPPKITLGRERA